MSLIGGTNKGDSNSFDGGEAEFTGEERAVARRSATRCLGRMASAILP